MMNAHMKSRLQACEWTRKKRSTTKNVCYLAHTQCSGCKPAVYIEVQLTTKSTY